jgi:tetratricopeptide (TPR) repeat protein/predicted Ser/Thr protein kinase
MKGRDSEWWQKLDDLFAKASELPPGEQRSFVEHETANDPEMRDQLAKLLAKGTGGSGRIAETIERAIQSTASAGNWIGRHFGSYRIVREIGRGGMGLVFEAVRADDEYQKRVALKVAPDWQRVGILRERFRHERQILAQLEHPNIARFLDGGTEDGIPYFVMEYIEGEPVTEYARSLNERARIELLQQICAAVDYAHGNLVVHRDLKPSNILVTRDGQVKLLDFGIAKFVNPFEGRATMTGMMWTPDYASPEQVRGGSVTTRTDVYSLGLLLYEMLTGRQGQIADTSSPLALDRSICELELPPSQLSADLDSIVRMAVRKEPERRYASVAALNEDLQRYLDGRPVLARPATFGYRAGKLVRRHRVAVAASVLIAGSIAGGVVSTVYQARRAERRFQQVRTLANSFVFDVHDRIAQLPGSTEARKAIVQTALTYLENLRQEAAGDASLTKELATAYERIGDVQGLPNESNLGDTAGALSSYRRAEALLTSIRSKDDSMKSRFASVSYKLAMMAAAGGDKNEAIARFSQARAAGIEALSKAPSDPDVLRLQSSILAGIAELSFDMQNIAAARDAAHDQTEVASRLVALNRADVSNRFALSSAYMSLGTAEMGVGNLEETAESYRRAISIREDLVRDDSRNAAFRRSLMIGYGTLGDVLGGRTGENLGDVQGAAAAFEKATGIAEWLTQNDPKDRKALFDLVSAELRFGSILLEDPQEISRGLSRLEQAERNVRKLLDEDPNNYRYRYNAMFLDRKIGDALAAAGRKPEAARQWEKAAAATQELMKGTLASNARLQRVVVNTRLAALHADAGDARAATLADSVAEEIGHPPSFFVSAWNEAVAYQELGHVYFKIGRFADAATWLEKSLERWKGLKAPSALASRKQTEQTRVEAELASSRSKQQPAKQVSVELK